jgi:hypothetical protein
MIFSGAKMNIDFQLYLFLTLFAVNVINVINVSPQVR